MKTDELIAVMAAQAAPVSPGAPRRRLLLAGLIGAVGTALLCLTMLGPWQGLTQAAGTGPFWMKAGYTLWLAIGGYMLVDQAARPGARVGDGPLIVAMALITIAVLASISLFFLPSDHWRAVWMGSSARLCPFRIIAAAAPVFIGVALVMRSLAPTRLGLAGAAAGLLAGAVGAAVYALWCRETAPLFVATWYTLGVAACTGVGALLGPKILRW